MKFYGVVDVPQTVVEYSDTIKLENYRVRTPERFQVRSLAGGDELMDSLARVIGLPRERLDFVYFSVAQGAEPHTDKLSPTKFEDTTFVIPTILPAGKSVIKADDSEVEVVLGGVYEFDHTKIHSMELEDTASGCVVVMVAVKKQTVVRN